ncbi:MAG: PhzF family phenazine biosynthesis protein [Firmicutes bacterium HGW-Firmicutes-2]|jgi:PhzF family phenazine biosynthesis protein|nr:MAG: PhzF family phenazine biosynthesis protein [Firmicutes bacterium HGW-Firmicutes-2]
MTNHIYRVTAFSDSVDGGNLAGVVLDADSLSEEQMLGIAKEVGYSETAFVMKSTKADYKVRFFTPTDEVDLCGHATIATFNLLRDLGIITVGDYIQETKAGILELQILDHYVYMEQNAPKYYEILDKNEIAGCFDRHQRDYIGDMPIQIVSTGLKDIILQVKDLKTLLGLRPNLEKINAISRKHDVVGIHAFCLETLSDVEAHVRNFAPRYGINEESATGTANAALACYLMKYQKYEFHGDFVIEQGYSMKRPSKIMVKVRVAGDDTMQVYVGGSAVLIVSHS